MQTHKVADPHNEMPLGNEKERNTGTHTAAAMNRESIMLSEVSREQEATYYMVQDIKFQKTQVIELVRQTAGAGVRRGGAEVIAKGAGSFSGDEDVLELDMGAQLREYADNH